MKFPDKKKKLDYLAELIESEQTGCPQKLAQRICVSRRTLFRYLDDLQAIGFELSYCFKRETYYIIERKNMLV